jgi:hypothetical protein
MPMRIRRFSTENVVVGRNDCHLSHVRFTSTHIPEVTSKHCLLISMFYFTWSVSRKMQISLILHKLLSTSKPRNFKQRLLCSCYSTRTFIMKFLVMCFSVFVLFNLVIFLFIILMPPFCCLLSVWEITISMRTKQTRNVNVCSSLSEAFK